MWILLLFCFHCVSAYLTPYQWKIIDNTFQYCRTLENQDALQPIHNFIYKHHHNWTINYTNNFVKTNKFYLRAPKYNELYVYATRGLLRAIRNYNGYGNFYSYGKIYMNGELYKGISELGPMRLLPHHYRVNKKWQQKNNPLYAKANMPIKADMSWERSFISNTNTMTRMSILGTLSELTNDERMLFSLRYDELMNKKYTLKQIGDFYGYSPETARQNIIKVHTKLKNLMYGLF